MIYNDQTQVSINYVYLERLIRVVAMRLKLLIIQFIKLYQPSDGLSFTSVSTYLQNNSSGCPTCNPHVLRVRVSHMGPIMHLSSPREYTVSQGSMGFMLLPWQPVGVDLSEGRQLCPL